MPGLRSPPLAAAHASRRLNSAAVEASPAAKQIPARPRRALRAASAGVAGDANHQHDVPAEAVAAANTAAQQLLLHGAGLPDAPQLPKNTASLTVANATAAAAVASAVRRPASLPRRMLLNNANGAGGTTASATAEAPAMPLADLPNTLPAGADGTIRLRLRLCADYGQTKDSLQVGWQHCDAILDLTGTVVQNVRQSWQG